MYNFKSLFCAGLLVVLYSCAAKIYFDKDESYSFNKVETFAWYPKDPVNFNNPDFDNQIIETNIKNYSSTEIKSRGMVVSVDLPDVIFDYQIMIEQKVQTVKTPYHNYPYNYNAAGNAIYRPNNPASNYNSQGVSGYTTQEIPYKEGRLTIMMIDRKTNRMIWRGWSASTVTNPSKYESELHADVRKIFTKFPKKRR